jgi:UDP-3-O-[3-hydroxymyristoyl] glucosamine N-acyltransferase
MTRTAGELARYLSAPLHGDPAVPLSGVANPGSARADDLIYVDSPRHLERAANSAAICLLVRPDRRVAGKTVIEVNNPKLAFAKAAAWLVPKPAASGRIHPTAIVPSTAVLASGVSLGPYVVVEDDVQIGAGTIIDAFCFLGRGSRVGEHCHFHPRVTLYAGSRLGNNVEIHSGVVIGGDGFGYVSGEGRHWKFPQIGSIEIGNDVEIGCNTTIDRGSLDQTRIGNGVKIDNLVQIGHNVEIGDHSVIVAQTGISGSSILGKNVAVGGQAGIGDHARIEDEAMVGGQAGVLVGKTIRRGQVVWGTPARPLAKFKEQFAWLARLPELGERIRKLEEQQKRK